MCLVLGVVAQPSLGSRQGNNFGSAFRSAAIDTEAQIEHDGFDSSIMQVRSSSSDDSHWLCTHLSAEQLASESGIDGLS